MPKDMLREADRIILCNILNQQTNKEWYSIRREQRGFNGRTFICMDHTSGKLVTAVKHTDSSAIEIARKVLELRAAQIKKDEKTVKELEEKLNAHLNDGCTKARGSKPGVSGT